MDRECALESSAKDLADSPSCISVSARRRGPRYLLGDLPTICQRSTGRVPALSNIYRTPLPPYVYCGELSRMHVCACTWSIGSLARRAPKNRRFFLYDRFGSSLIFRAHVASALIRIVASLYLLRKKSNGRKFRFIQLTQVVESRVISVSYNIRNFIFLIRILGFLWDGF